MIPQNLPIINYHKIELKSDIGLTTRHPDDFAEDLNIIRDMGFNTITFSDLAKDQKELPEKPLIITFDDAYLSFYDRALKTLAANDMKAVLFVPVNYIGEKNNWDVQFFKKEYLHMTATQIAECSRQGVEIGSHGMSHAFLNQMTEQSITYELGESKHILESITGISVITISYPFGRVNLKVLKLAAEYYTYGVQLLHSKTQKEDYENLAINRINIYRTDKTRAFIRKLQVNRYPMTKIKNQLIQAGALATVAMQKMNRHSK